VTFFTEQDVGQLRAVANVMRTAGCEVPEWMLLLKKERNRNREKRQQPGAESISTDPKKARKAERPGRGVGDKLNTAKNQKMGVKVGGVVKGSKKKTAV